MSAFSVIDVTSSALPETKAESGLRVGCAGGGAIDMIMKEVAQEGWLLT